MCYSKQVVQRTTCRKGFSPSTVWVLATPTELSHKPLLQILNHNATWMPDLLQATLLKAGEKEGGVQMPWCCRGERKAVSQLRTPIGILRGEWKNIRERGDIWYSGQEYGLTFAAPHPSLDGSFLSGDAPFKQSIPSPPTSTGKYLRCGAPECGTVGWHISQGVRDEPQRVATVEPGRNGFQWSYGLWCCKFQGARY